MPGRWPKLFTLVKQHHGVFLTWGTVRPAALALLLTVVNVVLSRVVFPQADISLNALLPEWWMLPALAVSAAAMLAVDGYFVVRVAAIDRADLEKYFDQAEFWLTTWKAPVVRFMTLGYVNPRRMVDLEVRKALEECSQLLNQSLYWVSLQVALRVLFGLLLWVAWATGK
jgi:hypothetical protein